MTKDEALDLALEALEVANSLIDGYYLPKEKAWLPEIEEAITAIKQARSVPVQEPVAHSVISGALFDFMGWLTSRKERIILSSADNASPAVEAITEFARMRNLSLDDAKVQDWHTHPPQRTWVGLTDDEIDDLAEFHGLDFMSYDPFTRAIEAKLKEKNT